MKEIIDAYLAGESTASLKKRYHMGYDRLVRIIGKHRLRPNREAVSRRFEFKPHPKSPSTEMRERIKELYQAEFSCPEIEGKTGVNRGVVLNIVREAGLSRSVGEAKAIARRKGRLKDWGYSRKRNDLVNLLLDECA